jgi:hypothetical protein
VEGTGGVGWVRSYRADVEPDLGWKGVAVVRCALHAWYRTPCRLLMLLL